MERNRTIRKAASKKSNVTIPFDATYFHEQGMRALDKHNYAKAMKYFRRAADLEPFNPSHHCNLAGVLSELGLYIESNNVLQHVLDEVDPEMLECHFYMANNHANLEDFEEAEQHLLLFLRSRTDAVFDPEIEEFVEYLLEELGRPSELENMISAGSGAFGTHDKARLLLEEGKFSEAIKTLEQLIVDQPDFMPARNNLALAYYYVGQFENALSMIQELLERDPHNVHGLCNMAIFLQHFGHQDKLQELMNGLRKMEPVQIDYAFKLATTLGILGDHEAAYRIFRRILRGGQLNSDASLYHYTAVAAFHIDKLDAAEQMWKHATKLDQKSGVADYYLNVLTRYKINRFKVNISYHYHLPFEEQFRTTNLSDESFPEKMRNDPLVRSSFFWALRYGDIQTKLQVLQAFSLIADDEVEDALRQFLIRAEEHDDLKKVALFVLRSMGASEPYQVHLRGKEMTLHPMANGEKHMQDSAWQDILELAMDRMRSRYSVLEIHEAQLIWFEYISKMYLDMPRFYKVEGWAAAIEYMTAKMHRRKIRFEDLSDIYGVSVSTIRKYVKVIQTVCEMLENEK